MLPSALTLAVVVLAVLGTVVGGAGAAGPGGVGDGGERAPGPASAAPTEGSMGLAVPGVPTIGPRAESVHGGLALAAPIATLDFETLPGGSPTTDGTRLVDQYEPAGIRFVPRRTFAGATGAIARVCDDDPDRAKAVVCSDASSGVTVATTPLRGSDEFNRHELGVEFTEPQQSVSVSVHHYRFHELPADWPEAVGELLGFDAAGQVIARDRVAFGPSEGWQRLAVDDPDGRIVGVELWFDRGSAQENWFVADDLHAEAAGAPPTAAFDYSPSDPWPGETGAFDASASNDRDGQIVSYGWRIASRDPPLLVAFGGDDSPTFDYTFEAAGEYEVSLTVTDDGEMRTTTTRTVVVRENAPPVAAFEFSPTAPVVGERADLDGSDSFDSDGTVGSYRWAVDGEFVGEGGTPRYRYEFPEPGEYAVTLTVTDDRRAADRATERVVVSDPTRPPTARISFAPGVPLAGDTVGFDATGSTDDGEILVHEWDLDGDGVFESTGPTVDRRYPTGGSFVVGLVVVDDDGEENATSTVVRVNEPPEAAFRVDPPVPLAGGGVTLDAGASTDDRRIVDYAWDLDGDGVTDATGRVVERSFETPGDRTVRLTVRDDDGVADSVTRTVTVLPPSTVEPTPTVTPTEPTPTATETTGPTSTVTPNPASDRGGDWPLPGSPRDAATVGGAAVAVGLAVLFRDEIVVLLGSLRLPRPGRRTTPPRGGRSPVTRRVPDPEETDEDEPNRPPTASVRYTPEEPTAGRPVLFDGTGSVDTDGRITAYRWSGDGPERTGSTVVHTFDEDGEYEVTLVVEDDDGATGERTVTVEVGSRDGEFALLSVHPDSPGRDHESLHLEYLTFGNVGEGPLDVGGWTVHDAAEEESRVREGEHTYAFEGTLGLDPEATVTLYTGTEPTDAPIPDTEGAYHRYWGRTWPVWNNEGDVVVVKDADANPVLAVRYTRSGEGYAVEPLDHERLEYLFPDASTRRDGDEDQE